MRPYRWYFVATTTTLLAYSFYKTYRGGCVPPLRNKIILWAAAVLSVGMTAYTLLRPYLL